MAKVSIPSRRGCIGKTNATSLIVGTVNVMNPTPSEPTDQTAKPGKIRTGWHPLLASPLRWQLGSHYHLEEEVQVGQKPLQIDILLLHKEQGELPASARQILAGLVEYLSSSAAGAPGLK